MLLQWGLFATNIPFNFSFLEGPLKHLFKLDGWLIGFLYIYYGGQRGILEIPLQRASPALPYPADTTI